MYIIDSIYSTHRYTHRRVRGLRLNSPVASRGLPVVPLDYALVGIVCTLLGLVGCQGAGTGATAAATASAGAGAGTGHLLLLGEGRCRGRFRRSGLALAIGAGRDLLVLALRHA